MQVLETRAPGQGATRASAGILAPYIEGHADIFRDLGARSIALYDEFIERLRADSGHELVYQRNGTFELAFSDDDVDRLTALSAALWKQGVEARWVPPAAFEDFEPHASSQAQGALLIPIHGFVGVTSLTLAAAAAAERAGAKFKTEIGAIRIYPLPGNRVGVQTSSSMWDADRVVLAAGSWSSQITVQDADPVPVKPIRGQLIQLQAEAGAIRRVLWGPNGLPRAVAGRRRSWSGQRSKTSASTNHTPRRRCGNCAPPPLNWRRCWHGAPMTSVRTGLRPRGPDDLPMLGASQAVPGLIYATAHYRNGVMFAPLTVQLVSDLVFDRGADPALRDLDPARHGKL